MSEHPFYNLTLIRGKKEEGPCQNDKQFASQCVGAIKTLL